jgi:hypothetical protein
VGNEVRWTLTVHSVGADGIRFDSIHYPQPARATVRDVRYALEVTSGGRVPAFPVKATAAVLKLKKGDRLRLQGTITQATARPSRTSCVFTVTVSRWRLSLINDSGEPLP